MTDDFTLEGYRGLLAALLRKGYRARSYADADPQATDLVLRHDLDMSLEAALPIVEIERELGVSSACFVLLRTEMYNPFSEAGLATLAELSALGCEIGLHFDASLYADDTSKMEAAIGKECTALETLIGQEIQTISFHRPTAALLGRGGRLAGRRHAYEPRFFSEMGYCSDSRGDWLHGRPLDHEVVAAGRALQLLTHPIWWNQDAWNGVQATLEGFALRRFLLLRKELGRNCETFDPDLPAKPFTEQELT